MADRDHSGRTLGEFILREPIGTGGYGAVYRSEQLSLKRDVAVKVLHPRSDHVAQGRFLREAQLASWLDHPFAAQVYAFGVAPEDGLRWIAMELVQGTTLKDWLKVHGAMPVDQLVTFFERLAEVVQAAHTRGIIHRDLKPSNVMVTEYAGRLSPKLLDLGIAKVDHEVALVVPPTWPDRSLAEDPEDLGAPTAGGTLTVPKHLRVGAGVSHRRNRTRPRRDHRFTSSDAGIGSGAYMSPEQWCSAADVGPPSDIYSLGIVAYETLTGHVPFIAESTEERYRLHCHAPVPPLGGDLPRCLDRVLRRALAKFPEDRYGGALEMASDLKAALRTQPQEQARSLAQQWEEQGRPASLLRRGNELAELERLAPAVTRSEPMASFIADSRREARRAAQRAMKVRYSLGAFAALLVFGAFQYHAEMRANFAEQLVTQAEVEQGRSAQLHNESAEAQLHLTKAYQRGEHSPGVTFMLARALQPRLAEQARFVSSAGYMWSAAFSPDGQRVVTTDDKNAQIWDVHTKQLLFTLPHGATVYQAVYSADGAILVTGDGAGTARIWDAAKGLPQRQLTRTRQDSRPRGLFAVALSPNGKLVAAIDTAGALAHVWDPATGAPLADLPNDASEFPSVAFSADGRWLATSGGSDVRVFDTRTWVQVRTLAGPGIHGLSWDPTGPRILTGSTKGDASIWEIPSGALAHHLREVGEPVDRVAFAPNGELVVTASRDGTEQVWSARSGAVQSQIHYLRDKVMAVEFDHTSKLVLAAGTSGTVVVADAEQGMPVAILEGPQNRIRVAHFDPSSRRVVGASVDGTARVWDATPPYRRWGSPPISDDCGVGTSLEPDRRFIAVGCKDHPTRVWDTSRDQLLAELPAATHVDGDFTSAFPAVSASGDRAAIAHGNAVEVYELPGGRLLRAIAHGAPVNAVAFASTGHDLVSGAVDGSLLVTRDDRDPVALPSTHDGIDAAGFLANGRVVAADAAKHLRIYALGSGAVLANVDVPTRVMLLRPSQDGLRLITLPPPLANPASPVLWDLGHYRIVAQLDGHLGRVLSARFVGAGHEIVTAGNDGTARLWDGATGQLRQTYRGSSRFLADVTLTPDGSMIVAGGGDGLLWFWDAVGGRALWTLQVHKSHLVGVHVEGEDIVTRGFSGEVSRWRLPRSEAVIMECGDRMACAIVPP